MRAVLVCKLPVLLQERAHAARAERALEELQTRCAQAGARVVGAFGPLVVLDGGPSAGPAIDAARIALRVAALEGLAPGGAVLDFGPAWTTGGGGCHGPAAERTLGLISEAAGRLLVTQEAVNALALEGKQVGIVLFGQGLYEVRD